MIPARALLLGAAFLAGCDLSPAVDLETGAAETAVVLRAVLTADAPPVVRVSVSRDPFGPVAPGGGRRVTQTPPGATVVLLRPGRTPETLTARAQTCYREERSTCNAATGLTETERADPFDCGTFVGQSPLEPGETVTVRASVPGLPPAEATVTVPPRAHVVADELLAAPDAPRRVRVRLRDVPGPDSRFSLALLREFDGVRTSVCARGGPRDTTIALGFTSRYQDRYSTADPLLLAGTRDPPTGIVLALFSDASFAGGERTFDVDVPRTGAPWAVDTGRLAVQVSVLSRGLSDAYALAQTGFDDVPFAEPVNLPSNVVGGFGRVEAASPASVLVGP